MSIKICHLTSLHPSDDVRIFHKECTSLSRSGFDVTLIAPGEKNNNEGIVKKIAIKKSKNRLVHFFLGSWEVLKKAYHTRSSVYHFHDPELIFVGIILTIMGKAVIYDVHEDLPKQILSKSWIHPLLRYPVSYLSAFIEYIGSRIFFKAIVCATPSIAENFPSQKTIIVQNFPIHEELFTSNIQYHDKTENVVVYIGGISRIRGVIESIKSMEYVKTPDVVFKIAGGFSDQALQEQCETLEGWKKVNYLGHISRTEVKDLLSNAKLGLVLFHPQPNHINAQPNKMFEYMSASVPVIASDFPLWREIIQKTDCGILVDPMDPHAIAEGIDQIFNDNNNSEKMAENGRSAILEKFNWNIEQEKLISLYRDITS